MSVYLVFFYDDINDATLLGVYRHREDAENYAIQLRAHEHQAADDDRDYRVVEEPVR